MKLTMTFKLATAAGQDAANRRMHKEGRTVWSEDDYNHAAQIMTRLLEDAGLIPKEGA